VDLQLGRTLTTMMRRLNSLKSMVFISNLIPKALLPSSVSHLLFATMRNLSYPDWGINLHRREEFTYDYKGLGEVHETGQQISRIVRRLRSMLYLTTQLAVCQAFYLQE
jgi:hypothetical protein